MGSKRIVYPRLKKFEARTLGDAGHQVKTLGGLGRRPYPEVVLGGEEDEASRPVVTAEPDIDAVRPADVLGIGAAVLT